MRGIVLAGTASSVGKTVATLAVIRALQRVGREVQPAKAGPDFIDPSHHATLANRPSRTLDTWMQTTSQLRRNYYRGSGDVCVVEGVMGLYDGEHSSTATVAEALDLPVVLVVDGSARMESVAATALGHRQFAGYVGHDIDVVGIIAQRVHGGRHENGIREALPEELTYFGRIPAREGLEIPDRHLGLHMGDEAPIQTEILDEIVEHIATQKLIEVAREPPATDHTRDTRRTRKRVAVARDGAFRFIYPAVFERLRNTADVVTFAPAEGESCPDCDGIYIPGGYPELHAAELADSPGIQELGEFASEGTRILGECGGMMVLAKSLTTTDGTTHEMAGILPAEVHIHDRFQALDHVELQARQGTLTATSGQTLRGHEFHYSSADVERDAQFAFTMLRGEGIDGAEDGLTEYDTLGTYSHVHAASGAFDRFVEAL